MLRAFAAAARVSSFTRAAQELCVTQTAISHQVRVLEEKLGSALFVRLARRIERTEQGKAWAAALSDASAGCTRHRALRAPSVRARQAVSVTALPSFALRWLLPRLGRFLEERPNADSHIPPGQELVDLQRSDFDVRIRRGAGRYPGLKAERLCGTPGWWCARPRSSAARS